MLLILFIILLLGLFIYWKLRISANHGIRKSWELLSNEFLGFVLSGVSNFIKPLPMKTPIVSKYHSFEFKLMNSLHL